MNNINKNISINDIDIGDIVYYTRIIPKSGMCYMQTLKVRRIYDKSIIGMDTATKMSYMIGEKYFNVFLFKDRKSAQNVIDKVDEMTISKEINEDNGED